MAEQNRPTLKKYFEAGKKPKQEEYVHLIDSFVNRKQDKIVDMIPDASATKKGKVELATLAEATAGTDKVRAVTPEGVKKAIEALAPAQSANEDSGWKAAKLPSGITPYHSTLYHSARYRKKNGVVYIEGMIKGGKEENTFTLFELLPGYRPNRRMIFNTSRSNGIQRTDITKAGEVICYAYNPGWTSISGISFLVDK